MNNTQDRCPVELLSADTPYKRHLFLQQVDQLINGDRAQEYGDAQVNFERIAKLWSAFYGSEFSAKQVAVMLGMLKMSRLATSIDHADSWKDLAGYVAIGATLK